MSLRSGGNFAGYRIVRLLGAGGMGKVYLTQHPRLPRQDALKVLPADVSADAAYRARFGREADLASTLWHPNIVGVHDRGEFQGQLWISMDYVDGLDAARLLIKKYPSGMPVELVIKIVTAVASALDYAHDQGLLHRDVKPANIMISNADGSGEQRILLGDFGIARNMDSAANGLTATNMTLGTVAYCAPEQLMGNNPDGRADQYALAATAYHLLTGTHLFPDSNPAAVVGKHLNATPPALAETHRELSGLDPVFAVALAKTPQRRFPRCIDFAVALAAEKSGTNDWLSLAATRPAALASAGPRGAAQPAPSDAATTTGSARGWWGRLSPTRRWTGFALLLIPVAIFGLWIGLAQDRQSASTPTPSSPSSSLVPATGTPAPTHSDVAVPSAPPARTAVPVRFDFGSMQNFVRSYYAQLPAGAEQAWDKLDSHLANENGYQDYLDFWSTVRSVLVLSVSPRDPVSVFAQLQYVYLDGSIATEVRWLSFVSVKGELRIYDSGVVE
jgi:serine/threonine-protein kinase